MLKPILKLIMFFLWFVSSKYNPRVKSEICPCETESARKLIHLKYTAKQLGKTASVKIDSDILSVNCAKSLENLID